ncbi:MAG: hypothetical protein R2824_06075 [Saprospiraceae bacterium]|nr:hypothetical protein [Lewinella sp.]
MDKRQLLRRVLSGDPDAISEAQVLSGANPLLCLNAIERRIFLFLDYGHFPELEHLDGGNTWLWPGAVIDWYNRTFGEPATGSLANWRNKFRQAFTEMVDQGERAKIDFILNNFIDGQKETISRTY